MENEKLNKYLGLTRELKRLYNMKVTLIFGALAIIPKNSDKWLGDLETRRRIKTIQTTGLLKIVLDT